MIYIKPKINDIKKNVMGKYIMNMLPNLINMKIKKMHDEIEGNKKWCNGGCRKEAWGVESKTRRLGLRGYLRRAGLTDGLGTGFGGRFGLGKTEPVWWHIYKLWTHFSFIFLHHSLSSLKKEKKTLFSLMLFLSSPIGEWVVERSSGAVVGRSVWRRHHAGPKRSSFFWFFPVS